MCVYTSYNLLVLCRIRGLCCIAKAGRDVPHENSRTTVSHNLRGEEGDDSRTPAHPHTRTPAHPHTRTPAQPHRGAGEGKTGWPLSSAGCLATAETQAQAQGPLHPPLDLLPRPGRRQGADRALTAVPILI